MTDNQIVQFNLGQLELISKKGGELCVSKEAEDLIQLWIKFEKQFELAKEQLKKNIISEMEKTNLIKVEGEYTRLLRRYFGERYEVIDPIVANDFITTETKIKADTKAIDEYIKEHNEVPDGIKLKERTMSLVISEINNEDETT